MSTPDETGASTIELAIVVPILLLVALSLLDVGELMVAGTSVDRASTAAARTMVADPASTGAALRAAADSDAPQIADAGYSITTERLPRTRHGYTHHMQNAQGQMASSDKYVVTQPVKVTVTLDRPFATPLGRALSAASGGDGKMHLESSTTMDVDVTTAARWAGGSW